MKKRYIKKLDITLSPLGFGVMRLPQNKDGSFSPEIYDLLAKSHELGINYYDTGYDYLGGKSETLIRDALVKHVPRNSLYIADKMPTWRVSDQADIERIFSTQLERLGVDYIDFYLLHALNKNYWEKLKKLGILEFLEKKRGEGMIHKVGFSLHDDCDVLQIIESPYDWDFVLLQINYYDWIIQHAQENYAYLEKRGIPVMAMEPVGGGRLANLPFEAESIFREIDPARSPAAWALRYVAALPNVIVTLSGMSDISQLKDNVNAVFDIEEPINEEPYNEVMAILRSKNMISCGGCGYCLGECPKKIDIPLCFQKYNDNEMFGVSLEQGDFGYFYFDFVPPDKQAHHCIKCGACNKRCPQGVDIPSELQKVHTTAATARLGVEVTDISKLCDNKKVILFGSSELGLSYLRILTSFGIDVYAFCDNNEIIWNTSLEGVKIISPIELSDIKDNAVVLISSTHYKPINEQLRNMNVKVIN